MANNAKIAADVLAAVGGKENVSGATHCMTRLRLNVVDETKVTADVDAVPGVIKLVKAGGQHQFVIGQNVDQVYQEFCKLGDFAQSAPVDAEQDAPKEKLTLASAGNAVMQAVAGSLTPVLPAIIAAGIFKMIPVLFGPSNLGLLTEESQLYITCNLVNSAIFYFLPFFVAWASAVKFKASPIFAMMLAAAMLHPDMLAIVGAGEPFSIYGLVPMKLVNYAQGAIPIILNTWILSYVEKWVRKIMPDAMRTIGVPVLTMAIMLPLGLCVFGPVCSVVMGWVANAILWLNDTVGIVAIVLVAALWNFLIMFGMHMPVMMTLLPVWMEMGYDAIVSPGSIASGMSGLGTELAYALRANTKEDRQLGWSCLVTNATANISEPAVYGIFLRDKKALAWTMIGAACGALAMYIFGGKVTLFSGVGLPFLNFLRFGEYAVGGIIGMVTAPAVSFVLGMVFGFEKPEAE